MHKYKESKMTRIMMATVRHVTSGLGSTKFQARLIFVGQSVHEVTSLAPVVSQTKLCHALS